MGPWNPARCVPLHRIAGINHVVLALRHATLRRTDLGSYSLEAFAAMLGWHVDITQGVREAEYLALRQPFEAARAKA